MIKRQVLFAIAIAVAAPLQTAQAGEFGINVHGLSYHFDRDLAEENDTDNEFNPGVGLRYRFAEWNRWSFDVEADIYRDSGRNTATVAGVAALYELGAGFRIGAGLAAFHSDTYNQGDPFVAPVPLVSYDWKAISLNATFFPKVSNFNDVSTLGFWLTIWPERW